MNRQMKIKAVFKRHLRTGFLARGLQGGLSRIFFPGTVSYWEKRYASGGTSGRGSYGKLALYKAKIVNSFVRKHHIKSVIEFGCGDGNQLISASYPKYVGLDVSSTAIKLCVKRFKNDETKSFFLYDPDCFADNAKYLISDLTLSLDVIYHLVEDAKFETYMEHLFSSARKFVLIYASNTDKNTPFQGIHIKHRSFSKWISENLTGWKLYKKITNKYPPSEDNKRGSFADFYIYKKVPR
jgi:cyclopropane fatty-acyl-phospholipid synthase-like methyltransferase